MDQSMSRENKAHEQTDYNQNPNQKSGQSPYCKQKTLKDYYQITSRQQQIAQAIKTAGHELPMTASNKNKVVIADDSFYVIEQQSEQQDNPDDEMADSAIAPD